MLRKIIIIMTLIILLLSLTGCSENQEEIKENTNYEIRLLPMCFPLNNGTIQMILMPKLIEKSGEINGICN